jgi:hypothetical protein
MDDTMLYFNAHDSGKKKPLILPLRDYVLIGTCLGTSTTMEERKLLNSPLPELILIGTCLHMPKQIPNVHIEPLLVNKASFPPSRCSSAVQLN